MEAIVFFDSTRIQEILSFPTLIHHLRSAFSRSHAFSVPHRHHHTISSSSSSSSSSSQTPTLLLMPAWSHLPTCPYAGVKIVSIFPANLKTGLPSLAASYLLSSSITGQHLAFMDGKAITLWRTAAVSALAADYLARHNAEVMVMVGSGAMAPYLIKAHIAARPSLRKIFVWNRTPSRAQALVDCLNPEFQPGFLEACANLEEVVRVADLVSCATLSDEPLVLGSWLKPGAHLDLVGSFTPKMKECDRDALARGLVYIDTEAALQESGELIDMRDEVVVVGTLAQLTTGEKKGRQEAGEITVFKSVGCAMADLITGQLVYEKGRYIGPGSQSA